MRIALAQTEPLWEDKEGNFKAALTFLERAREQNADLVLFPEMSMTGFSMHPEKIGETGENPRTLSFFREQAERYGLYIGVGYVELCEPKSFNRYAVLSPRGEVLADYRKIHPFTFGTESAHYAGGEELAFCQVKEFTLSPLICYDLRFPELFEIASERAELIVVPANWPSDRREHFMTLLRARAIEDQCYIAGVNRVGRARTLSYSGDSRIVDPFGRILAKAEDGEELVFADLDLESLRRYRKEFPARTDRKPALYERLRQSCRM